MMLNNCETCKFWQPVPTNNSDKIDRDMERLGYRNCLNDRSAFAFGRFVFKHFGCRQWKPKE